MLTYNLKNTQDPLYLALYNSIKADILNGKLRQNEKLPSKKQLASYNGVSVITVENAYSLLVSEGYIFSKPKSGFYVCDLSCDIPHEFAISHPKPDIPVLSQNDSLKSKLIMDFSNNQTPSDLFPFENWLKATKKIFSEKRENLLENSLGQGILPLRHSIAKYLREYRGLWVDEKDIVVGAGSEYLYGILVQLLGRDAIYGIENPGYRKQEKIYKAQGVRVEYLNIDENGMNPKEFDSKDIGVLHITPSHQYPTGIIMPISRRYELLAWAAAKKGRYIIEDDYDSELRLEGKPIPSFKSIDTEGCVIYLNTFSKTLCSTVRISYMVLPPELLRRYNSELSFYSCTVPTFEQYTLQEFMENGRMACHISKLRTCYRRKRDALIKAIKNSRLAPFVEISQEKAGLHFLMKVSSQIDEESIVQRAKEKGIGLCTLSSFYHEEASSKGAIKRNIFVMNYATLDMSKIDEIVEKLNCIL